MAKPKKPKGPKKRQPVKVRRVNKTANRAKTRRQRGQTN